MRTESGRSLRFERLSQLGALGGNRRGHIARLGFLITSSSHFRTTTLRDQRTSFEYSSRVPGHVALTRSSANTTQGGLGRTSATSPGGGSRGR